MSDLSTEVTPNYEAMPEVQQIDLPEDKVVRVARPINPTGQVPDSVPTFQLMKKWAAYRADRTFMTDVFTASPKINTWGLSSNGIFDFDGTSAATGKVIWFSGDVTATAVGLKDGAQIVMRDFWLNHRWDPRNASVVVDPYTDSWVVMEFDNEPDLPAGVTRVRVWHWGLPARGQDKNLDTKDQVNYFWDVEVFPQVAKRLRIQQVQCDWNWA